jgi:hypothetical protein
MKYHTDGTLLLQFSVRNFNYLEMHLQNHLDNGARNDPVFDLVLHIQPCNE